VTFQKSFRTLARKHLAKSRVGVRQRHHKQSDLRQFAVPIGIRESKVRLRFTRRVAERQEYFARTLLPRSHGVLDDRQAASVVMLVAQPLKDPLGRVLLLAMNLSIVLQNLVDDRQKPAILQSKNLRFICTLRFYSARQPPPNATFYDRRPLGSHITSTPAASIKCAGGSEMWSNLRCG